MNRFVVSCLLVVASWGVMAPTARAESEPVHALESGPANALEVGPTDAPLVIAGTALGRIEEELFTFLEHLERLGLEDPGLRRGRAIGLRKLGKKKGTLTQAVGIDPKGAMAMYGVFVEERMVPVFAVDIVDRDALVRALSVAQEESQWVPYGEKPKSAAVTKRELAGGGFEATIAMPEETGVTMRVLGRVAIVATEVAALDQFRLVGGQRIDIADRLAPGVAGMVMRLRPPSGGMVDREIGLLAAVFESLDLVWRETGAGFEADGSLRFATDLEPWLAVGKPGPGGAAAREVMRAMVGPETGMWGRWSVDAQAAWSLAKTMLGEALEDVQKEVKRETGLDLKRDLVDAFTGDLLFTCDDGVLSCVLVVGTAKGGRAAATVKKALDASTKDSERNRLKHDRSSLPSGRTLHRTVLEVKQWQEDERAPAKWDPSFQFYWGARDHAVVFGLTRDGVLDALTRTLSGPSGGPEFLTGRGFDAQTGAAFYQRGQEPMRVLRLIAAVLRGMFPAESDAGMGARAFEFFAAAEDYMWERATILESNGLEWTVRGVVTTLPTVEGTPGFDAALAKAWDAALALRYQGKQRKSNEAMLALSDRAPDSPWGKKGRGYALASDDVSMLTSAFYLFGLVGARGMMASMSRPDAVEAAPAPQPPAACISLESMTCSGPSYNQGSCQIALNGFEADCEAELQAVLGAP